MKVKCRIAIVRQDDPECPYRYLDLTVGKVYEVVNMTCGDFRLVGDDGCPYLYPPEAFDVIDPTPGKDWVRKVDEDGSDNWYGPAELDEPGLMERYFDGDEAAWQKLKKYIPNAKWPRW